MTKSDLARGYVAGPSTCQPIPSMTQATDPVPFPIDFVVEGTWKEWTSRPTLYEGTEDDLKSEAPGVRVWTSQRYEGDLMVEVRVNGVWREVWRENLVYDPEEIFFHDKEEEDREGCL